jgi:hypothetical protein
MHHPCDSSCCNDMATTAKQRLSSCCRSLQNITWSFCPQKPVLGDYLLNAVADRAPRDDVLRIVVVRSITIAQWYSRRSIAKRRPMAVAGCPAAGCDGFSKFRALRDTKYFVCWPGLQLCTLGAVRSLLFLMLPGPSLPTVPGHWPSSRRHTFLTLF